MSQVVKAKGAAATPLEKKVAEVISQITDDKIKADIAPLSISAVKEVKVDENKKAYVIFVPYRQHNRYKKVQKELVAFLEKKFPNTSVVIIAQRTILSDAMARYTGQKRAHSRTLTAVNEAVLEDVVAPHHITGKRIRFKTDGTQLLKVFLDAKDFKGQEDKLKTFAAVYKRLTNRNVVFGFGR